MDNLGYTFSVFNNSSRAGIFQTLLKLNPKNLQPVFVCIGSDLVVGDSLGPLCGTMIKNKKLGCFCYGSLTNPITAKEVQYAKKYICATHSKSQIIAIDAGVGNGEDVGLIRVKDRGLKPGLAVHKRLGEIGDGSIVGIVASKSLDNYNLFNLTRLSLVYKMSEIIVGGISDYLAYLNGEQRIVI